MKTITREKYLDRMIALRGTPDIKIITGIRRSGKSKLMQAYMEYLKNHFEDINIIFIDFMDLAYEEVKEPGKQTIFSWMKYRFARSLNWRSTVSIRRENMIFT